MDRGPVPGYLVSLTGEKRSFPRTGVPGFCWRAGGPSGALGLGQCGARSLALHPKFAPGSGELKTEGHGIIMTAHHHSEVCC